MEKHFRHAEGIQRRTAMLTAGADDYVISGYAATFNSWSKNLGGFREQIAAGAFKRSIQQKADVKMLFNHAPDNILGRTKSGTLRLMEDGRGLRFMCQLNKDSQQHRDLWGAVKRGDISECSFAFTVPAGGQIWSEGRDSETGETIALRTLTDVDLVDVSVVTYPAYDETSADARHAVELNRTHGIIEAVAYLRGITKRLVIAMRGGDSSPVDFAGHLAGCHEHAEMACLMAKRCDDAMDDDDDADEEVKAYFRYAKAACNLAAENYASARVRHLRNLTAKQQAKVLGRSR